MKRQRCIRTIVIILPSVVWNQPRYHSKRQRREPSNSIVYIAGSCLDPELVLQFEQGTGYKKSFMKRSFKQYSQKLSKVERTMTSPF